MSQFHDPYGKDYEFPMHLYGELESDMTRNKVIKDIYMGLLSAMNAFAREKASADERRKALATAYTLMDELKAKEQNPKPPVKVESQYKFFPAWSEKIARLLKNPSSITSEEVKELCLEFRWLYDRFVRLESQLIEAQEKIKQLQAENAFMLRLINEKELGE